MSDLSLPHELQLAANSMLRVSSSIQRWQLTYSIVSLSYPVFAKFFSSAIQSSIVQKYGQCSAKCRDTSREHRTYMLAQSAVDTHIQDTCLYERAF